LAAVLPFLSPPLAGSSTGPSPGALNVEPLRLWQPLSTSKVQPWQHQLPPWPHIWLIPPQGTALGPLMGEAMRLWAPTYFQSPVLAAEHPTLAPYLAGSSTGPCPGAPDREAPETVGAPIHSQSPFMAAVPPILSPPLAGSSTGPSPGAPDGRPLETIGGPAHWCSPWCTHWYTSDFSRL